MSDEAAVEPSGSADLRSEAGPVSRAQLYELVWREPMLRVGERFGLSSSYMARVCTELRVPRPPRGYWAQREFGKAPAQEPLPDARPGEITEWSPGDLIGTAERAAAKRLKTSASAEELPQTALVRRRERRRSEPEQRHPLLVGVKPFFQKTRDSETGILRPFKRLLVDIMASKEGLDGVIAVADRIFRELTSRGHRVAIAPVGAQMRREGVDLREVPEKNNHYHQSTWSPERPTVVYVGEVPVGLTLFEMTEATEMQYVGNSTYVPINGLSLQQRRKYEQSRYWTTTKDKACGRLCLQAYCPSWGVDWVKRWPEVTAGQLASLLPEIVEELESAAPQLATKLDAARIEAEERHRQWEEEDRRRREAHERALQEKRRQDARQELLSAIAAWDEARRVAAYFADVEHTVQRLDADQRERLQVRIALARELVGSSDPLDLLLRWKAPEERR